VNPFKEVVRSKGVVRCGYVAAAIRKALGQLGLVASPYAIQQFIGPVELWGGFKVGLVPPGYVCEVRRKAIRLGWIRKLQRNSKPPKEVSYRIVQDVTLEADYQAILAGDP
jgi:hypothetical protein